MESLERGSGYLLERIEPTGCTESDPDHDLFGIRSILSNAELRVLGSEEPTGGRGGGPQRKRFEPGAEVASNSMHCSIDRVGWTSIYT